MSDLTDTERAGMALLMCECGHDIGGEHNSNGCYHIDWDKNGDDRQCNCTRGDDRDLVQIAGERHLAIVAARVAAARANERARLGNRLRDIIATPDDEQWWPVEPYTDPANDDEVVEVQVINADRLRALIEGADQ